MDEVPLQGTSEFLWKFRTHTALARTLVRPSMLRSNFLWAACVLDFKYLDVGATARTATGRCLLEYIIGTQSCGTVAGDAR